MKSTYSLFLVIFTIVISSTSFSTEGTVRDQVKGRVAKKDKFFRKYGSSKKKTKKIPREVSPTQRELLNMPWSIVSQNLIKNSPCRKKNIASLSENQKIIENSKTIEEFQGLASEVVHGVEIKNENQKLINSFKALTTAYDSFGYAPAPDQQINFQENFHINPTCEKVECAVKKIWGNELGLKILALNLYSNFNASEYAFSNSSRFTIDEINDVIIAVADIPKHILEKFNANQRMTHFKRKKTFILDPEAYASAIGIVTDKWSDVGSEVRHYTLYHEISHMISYLYDHADEGPEWLEVSDWITKGDKTSASSRACFVSSYAKTNPAEDFAESLTSYRYNANFFKKNCLEKYNYIKKEIYNDIEFTSVEKCTDMDEVGRDQGVNIEEKSSESNRLMPLPIETNKIDHSINPDDSKVNQETDVKNIN